jgi:hypothetical protein
LEIAMQALAEIRALFGIGQESATAVANSGPIEIVTKWGGALAPTVESVVHATATVTSDGNAATENAAHSGNTAATDAEQND